MNLSCVQQNLGLQFFLKPHRQGMFYSVVTRSDTEHTLNSGWSYLIVCFLSFNVFQGRTRKGEEGYNFSSSLNWENTTEWSEWLEYNIVLREIAKEVNRFQGKGRKINNPQWVISWNCWILAFENSGGQRWNQFYRFLQLCAPQIWAKYKQLCQIKL